ncbi:hypothetical protein [Stratiformator vulcanicus]|uniref:Uncharacterized protein n=1 Tax=Stratiformator vulcanicus TaxID=2527980 RepID=A0A517R2I5_9PLAN|nr:hypothetical protein [Stratiformator vulcanicus]QDT38095.1 hypothetical protein Pan189_24850 [Stratiformator vulcanicus]
MNSAFQRCFFSAACAVLLAIGQTATAADCGDLARHAYHPEHGYPLHTYHPDHGYIPYAGTYGVGGVSPGVSAGVAAAGRGQEAAGIGQMNVDNAQAQILHQQAAAEFYKNRGLKQDAALSYYNKKEAAEKARDEATDAETRRKVAEYNKSLTAMESAHRLSAEKQDVEAGTLHWPYVLRDPAFAAQREIIDKAWAARTPDDSGENSTMIDTINNACETMQSTLKEKVRDGLSVTDFITAKHFISSIKYEAKFPVKPKS